MATATLVTLILLFVVNIIYVLVWVMVLQVGTYDPTTGTFDTSVNETMILILSIIGYILIGLALIFSGIFTWGRKCGAPRV